MLKITKLPPSRWKEYRDLRLEALRGDPTAFGSSFEDEVNLAEDEWRRRIKNTLFAMSDDDAPIGMIVCLFNDRPKTRHIADIVGVYVSADHRGQGVGTRMLNHVLSLIRSEKRIVKVKLAVNPEQRAAVRLYEKAGFLVTGRTKKELKVGHKFFDMLFMEKHL